MPSLNEGIARLRALLEELDAFQEGAGGEALEDLNAELDDMLLALSDIRPGREDWREELDEALEDLDAVVDDYRRLAAGMPGLMAYAERLGAESAALRNAM